MECGSTTYVNYSHNVRAQLIIGKCKENYFVKQNKIIYKENTIEVLE